MCDGEHLSAPAAVPTALGERCAEGNRREKKLPITFWTDLGYKELPSVKTSEGSMFTDHNCLINWNWCSITISSKRRASENQLKRKQQMLPMHNL